MSAEIKAFVITVSDSRDEQTDVSGKILTVLLLAMKAEVVGKLIIKDDLEVLTAVLKTQSEREDVNLIITTGGTGFAERDITPEATRAVIEKEAQGIAEAMRFQTMKNTPMAMLSRGVCGIRHHTLILNFPGSPKGVQECFEIVSPILQHAINLLSGITNH